MDNHRAVLKRVGLALILVGVLDIACMVYCIFNRRDYSSSFNIFAVLAGVFLLRNSLGAVRVVTLFAAFMFAGFASLALLFPFLKPAGLWTTEFRLDPVGCLESLLFGVLVIAFIFWVYLQLRSAPVLAALAAAGRRTAPPRFGFIAGVALAIILAGLMLFSSHGQSAAKAIELARAQYGNDYQYFVESLNWSNAHVSANLAAYNEHEIKTVHVEW